MEHHTCHSQITILIEKKKHLMIPRSSKFTTGKRAPATISHEDQYATSFNYRYKPFKSIILHKEQ